MSTTLSYGYLADIIQQSDQWRKLGRARYNLSGIIQFLRNKSYHVHLKIKQIDQKYSTKKLLENLNGNILGNCSSKDIEFEGNYQLINCLNVACRCSKSAYGMSPSVLLNDGSFDLILLKHSSTIHFLRFLRTVANDATDIEHLPNVQRYRSKYIQIRAHQQILPLFATGIHFQQIRFINQINKLKHFLLPSKKER